jgi:hypothetical protein
MNFYFYFIRLTRTLGIAYSFVIANNNRMINLLKPRFYQRIDQNGEKRSMLHIDKLIKLYIRLKKKKHLIRLIESQNSKL